MDTILEGKHIILGITGGIAAYKSVYLLRLLRKAGVEVQVILTPSGKEFITPVTLSSLTGKPVISEFFTANTGEWNSHVDLGLWSDLFVIAPATANTLAKMANGIADNMLLTTYLSSKKDVMVAPAMDLDMWKHPSTQRNLKQLVIDGVHIIEPSEGQLASGLEGKGRMAEPETIFIAIKEYFNKTKSLKGLKALVTAGPTYEKIDPVRFIGNFSSGKMGFSVAEELANRGASVTLVTGPTQQSLSSPEVKRVNVISAEEMLEQCKKIYNEIDIAFFSAAVADYRPENCAPEKLKREKKDEMDLHLVKNPDIAKLLGDVKGNKVNIGFALETENGVENAIEKIKKKNLDWIVLNNLSDPGAGFNFDTNKVTIISKEGEKHEFPLKPKKEVAKDIVDLVCERKQL